MRPAARHGQNFGTLLETVYYDYWGGSARQIVSKAEGDPVWRRTWFQFDGPGRAWMTVQDNWELNTNGTIDEDTLSRSRCTEFRYGGSGRHRYLTRALNPETLQPNWCHDGRWSDYFAGGDWVYTDYSLTVGDAATNDTPDYVVTNDMTRHMPGAWQSDASTSGTWSTSFIHGDQIDSMRTMTAGGGGGGPGAGTIVQRRVYTAFGESVHESGEIYTRYGYAGAYGYGGGEPLWFTGPQPMTLLHVGDRLYEPTSGRFLQRDPIGLAGGMLVYVYSRSSPTARVDPLGHQSSHMRPDGLITQVDLELKMGKTLTMQYRGVKQTIVGIREAKNASEAGTLLFEGGAELTIRNGKQVYEVTKCASGYMVDVAKPAAGGGCGCTGLEIVPIWLLMQCLRRRRPYS